MSHRVLQFDSDVSSSSKADALQTKIKQELDTALYDLHERNVNDGSRIDGTATLAVKTDHNVDSEANKFFDWLWNFAQNNKASYNKDGTLSSEGFTRVRVQVHDCQHLEGLNEPCKIGNAEKFEVQK
jgi:hypothetical protein